MLNRFIYVLFFVIFIAPSCSNSYHDELDDFVMPDIAIESVVGSDEVAISASTSYTRTAIDDAERGSVSWLTGDKVHLWAYSNGSEKISNAEFSLRYYGAEYDEAIFIGNVTGLTDPASVDYTYYAVHPTPKSVSGSVVSYHIPIMQSGRYDETSCDPMVAVPSVAPAMQMGERSSLNLSFKHMAHVLRLQIPDDRCLLSDNGVTALSVEFPAPIVNGDLSFDYKSGEYKGFSGMSNKVIVNLDQPTMGDGNYIWVFINPQTVTGDITFKFYDDTDHSSYPISTTVTNCRFGAGEITPIDLTVPERVKITDFRLRVTDNFIGENPNTVSFAAPSGTTFFDGSTTVTYEYIDDPAYEYIVEFDGPMYNSMLKNGSITATFDSDHTIVKRDIELGAFANNTITRYTTELPYVLYEDFSSIKDFSYRDNPGVGTWDSDAAEGKAGVSLSDSSYGSLPTVGWTANRTGAKAGTAMRIMSRYESGGGLITGHYEGRLDSPAFAVIKDGAEVDLEVSFDYKGGRYSKYYEVKMVIYWSWINGGSGTGVFNYGYTTASGAQNGEDDIENKILSSYEALPDTEGSYSTSSQNYDNISLHRTYTIPNATNKTRASWRASSTMEDTNFLGANGNFWLYIDNIKVQVKKK